MPGAVQPRFGACTIRCAQESREGDLNRLGGVQSPESATAVDLKFRAHNWNEDGTLLWLHPRDANSLHSSASSEPDMATSRVVEQTIRQAFPHPVAFAWRRIALESSDAGRIKQLIACQAAFLRTLVALQLPDYVRGTPSRAVEDLLPKLGRPSQGHLVALLREMLACLRDRESPPMFAPEAAEWYFSAPDGDETPSQLFDRLVTLRNKEVHGQPLHGLALSQRADQIADCIRRLLRSSHWLTGYRLLRQSEGRLVRGGGFKGKVQYFVGVEPHPEPLSAAWSAELLPEAVYLVSPSGDGLLEVSPFVQWIYDESARAERLFVLQSIRRAKKLVLVNDATGTKEARLLPMGADELPFDRWGERREEWRPFVANAKRESFQSGCWTIVGAVSEVLDERYEVRGLLGQGGMATVYRVWDRWDEAEFALKVLAPQLSGDAAFRERFLREARMMKRLRHPNIVRVEETGRLGDGRLWLKMPVFEGGTLDNHIVAGGVDPGRLTAWATEVLSALETLHGKLMIHRDVKLSNLLVDEDGHAHLTDFGIALREGDSRLTRTREQLGTMAYLAPERMRGEPAGPESDVYALGCVLHELMTGVRATREPGIGLEGSLGEVIREMTATEPANRLTAAEALRRLETETANNVGRQREPSDPHTPARRTEEVAVSLAETTRATDTPGTHNGASASQSLDGTGEPAAVPTWTGTGWETDSQLPRLTWPQPRTEERDEASPLSRFAATSGREPGEGVVARHEPSKSANREGPSSSANGGDSRSPLAGSPGIRSAESGGSHGAETVPSRVDAAEGSLDDWFRAGDDHDPNRNGEPDAEDGTDAVSPSAASRPERGSRRRSPDLVGRVRANRPAIVLGVGLLLAALTAVLVAGLDSDIRRSLLGADGVRAAGATGNSASADSRAPVGSDGQSKRRALPPRRQRKPANVRSDTGLPVTAAAESAGTKHVREESQAAIRSEVRPPAVGEPGDPGEASATPGKATVDKSSDERPSASAPRPPRPAGASRDRQTRATTEKQQAGPEALARAAKMVELARKSTNAKLKVLYLIKAVRFAPENPHYRRLLELAKAQLAANEADTSEGLPKSVIKRHIDKRIVSIKACYKEGLKTNRDLQGRVKVVFLIQAGGDVAEVEVGDSDLKDAAVESCIKHVIETWRFPRAENGESTKVVYPFYFRNI